MNHLMEKRQDAVGAMVRSGKTLEEVKAQFAKLLPGYQILPMREYMSMMSSNNLPALRAFITVLVSVAVVISFPIGALPLSPPAGEVRGEGAQS